MKTAESLQKHLIRLYSGDFDRLGQIYHVKRPNAVIRQLVRRHLDEAEARIREKEHEQAR
jgi:hypothetical protein